MARVATSILGSAGRTAEDLAKWNWQAGHLVIEGGRAYACSSLPVSKTFAGKALGLRGREPDVAARAELAPERTASNTEPASIWRFDLEDDLESDAIAISIEEAADPRYL